MKIISKVLPAEIKRNGNHLQSKVKVAEKKAARAREKYGNDEITSREMHNILLELSDARKPYEEFLESIGMTEAQFNNAPSEA